MEIIFEIIYEIFIEGLVGATKSKKIPIFFRLLIATFLCGSLIAISVLAGISALDAAGLGGAVFCWVIGIGFFALWLFWCIKIIKINGK